MQGQDRAARGWGCCHLVRPWWTQRPELNKRHGCGHLPGSRLGICLRVGVFRCSVMQALELTIRLAVRHLRAATESRSGAYTSSDAPGRKPGAAGARCLAARGTRREAVPGGPLAASMSPTVPQAARTPHQHAVR
ncbi:hypothetical protein XAPC_3459 [Xanthomonas citri pv. punicae str. LMG 859]|nr:hypothetical protein XAPC_3459 [Xanthomonas citri pv. punicae str. LMG 859]